MVGGGLGPYEPGEWSDDTQMAICIARVSATGADLTSEDALDQIAEGFLDWQLNGATDIGNQTRRVLGAARQGRGRPAARLRQAAAEDLALSPHSAGNGALMRTSVVGLTRLDDRRATAEAAVGRRRTDPSGSRTSSTPVCSGPKPYAGRWPTASWTCWAAWTCCRRNAGTDGASSSWPRSRSLCPPSRRTGGRSPRCRRPGVRSSRPVDPAPAGSELFEVFSAAIGIGDDTDTVAAIAGGLAGGFWGAGALAAEWVSAVHGWPGMDAADLRRLASLDGGAGTSMSEWRAGVAAAAVLLVSACGGDRLQRAPAPSPPPVARPRAEPVDSAEPAAADLDLHLPDRPPGQRSLEDQGSEVCGARRSRPPVNRRVRASAQSAIKVAVAEGRDDQGERRTLTGEGEVTVNDGRTVQVRVSFSDNLRGDGSPDSLGEHHGPAGRTPVPR